MGSHDLRERLRRLDLHRAFRPAGDAGRPQPVRRLAAAPAPIESLITGDVVTNRYGDFFLHVESHAAAEAHGVHHLGDLLAHLPHAATRLARDERMAGVAPDRIAFLDTETTGLAGGTGTTVFLVGVGAFDEAGFTIRQFFMPDFSAEWAQLLALGELLDGYEAVVSFNGKQFDLPLIETRYSLARREVGIALPGVIGAPHLDLLTTARTFWKHRLDSCALSSLEAEVLGVRREQEDVPGWLIPSLYHEYTSTRDAGEMPRIFYHNAQDILSLVSLAARQCTLLASPLPPPEEVPGEDLYGLGRLLHDLGEEERAETAFALAARTSHRPGVREAAMRDLAYLLKRQERRPEALALWEELADRAGAVYACEELAKHYEWQDGDPAQALAWTERGLALAQVAPFGPGSAEVLASLEHRRERLRAKTQSLPAQGRAGAEQTGNRTSSSAYPRKRAGAGG